MNTKIAQWPTNLGYSTFALMCDTPKNTTQMVKSLQAESREYLYWCLDVGPDPHFVVSGSCHGQNKITRAFTVLHC